MQFKHHSHFFSAVLALSVTGCLDDLAEEDSETRAESETAAGDPTASDSDARTSDDPEEESDTSEDESDTEGDPGGSSSSGEGSSSGGEEAITEIRVLHLSPDAPDVDVYVNGGEAPAIVDIPFQNGTGYVALPPGSYTFDVAPTASSLGDSVLTVADLPLEEGLRYTAVAYDEVANITALALLDDDSDIDDGNIRFQVSHTAVAVPEVDIIDVASGTIAVPDLEFGNSQTLDVPSGARRLGLDVDNDASPEFLYDVPDLGGGILVNVFAVNDKISDPFLIAQLPDGQTARIDPTPLSGLRVVHLSRDAGLVDVYVNDSPTAFLEDVPFTAGTGYFSLAPGAYNIDIAPADTSIDDAVLSVDGLTLDPGLNYTAAAINKLADISELPLLDDVEGLADTDTRFQIVHAGPEVPEVDILAGGAALVSDLSFSESQTIDVPSGAYTVGIDVGNDGNPDLLFDVPELGGGVQANVYATNDNHGNVFLLAHLSDGTIVRIDPNPSH